MIVRLALKSFVALGMLSGFVAGVQSSEEDERKHCPSHREWASTINPENRPFFFEFSTAAIGGEDIDRGDEIGWGMIDRFYSLLIHSYHDTAEYRDLYAGLFEEMRQHTQVRERYGDIALAEIARCMTGRQQIDCAEMALSKGYVKTLEDLSDAPGFIEHLSMFKEFCQLD